MNAFSRGKHAIFAATARCGYTKIKLVSTDATLGLGGDEADASQTAADATGGTLGNNTGIVSAFTGGQPSGLIHGFSLWVRILFLPTVLIMLW